MYKSSESNNLLYEGGFFANYKYWTRCFNPSTKSSFITDKYDQKWEYYKEDPEGSYSSIYDDTKYSRFYGSSKEAKGYQSVSAISPLDLTVRKFFRGLNNLKPRVMYLDIETRVGTVRKGFPVPDKALEPISLIQFLDSFTDKVHIIGDKDFYFKDYYLSLDDHRGKEVIYHHCNSEREILDLWFNFVEELTPAVVYAWNGEGFDFPYLYNRCKRIGMNVARFCPFWKRFESDPDMLVNVRENYFGGRYTFDLKVSGCYYIDIKRLYQKLVVAPRPSYALNSIAQIEVQARKIEHQEFKTFDDFYLGNYTKPEDPTPEQKETLCYKLSEQGADLEDIRKAGHGQFVYYGVIDVVLLQAIDEKVGLTALMASVSNIMESQYDTILGTTKPWANFIRNVLWDDHKVINPDIILKRGADLEKTINGGFVREPETGKHKWVLSADVNSMYPMLGIAGSNMSPDTFKFSWELSDEGAEGLLKQFALQYLKVGTDYEQQETNLLSIVEGAITDPEKSEILEKLKYLLDRANLTLAPNGVFFDKSKKGVIPDLVTNIYNKRKKVKKYKFKLDQKAIDIQKIIHQRESNN